MTRKFKRDFEKEANLVRSEDPVEYKTHGGKREGSGRKRLGVSKKISIALPRDQWEMVEAICEAEKITKAEFFRRCYVTTMKASLPYYDDSWLNERV